jgi:N-acetylmuramoyl-L-alanine amidase
VAGPGGVQVPLDLLELTYGDALGYGFDWDGVGRRLYVDRRRARDLPLAVDVVDLGGTTTVVLRFREKPRYRIVEGPRRVDVEVLGDRVDPRVAIPRFDGGLIRDIEVTPHRIRLELAPDAEASSYSLSRPSFRLVFDVHRPAAGVAGTSRPPYEPPDRRPGVRTIVIDPGHGGNESGAVGPDGALEKDLTLLLARSLRRRLLQRLPVEVVLTRDEDVSLPLETRTAIANENKGDLFISLHLNSSLGAMAAGAETYFLSLQASDERAAEAAATENQSAGAEAEADPLRDLQLILWDLAQSRHLADSQRLAKLIQEELNVTLGLRDRGVRQAPFRVLMGAAMPAVLVELGFLNNPVEEQKLVDPGYRDELVEAVVRAVVRYRAQSLGGEAESGEELQ